MIPLRLSLLPAAVISLLWYVSIATGFSAIPDDSASADPPDVEALYAQRGQLSLQFVHPDGTSAANLRFAYWPELAPQPLDIEDDAPFDNQLPQAWPDNASEESSATSLTPKETQSLAGPEFFLHGYPHSTDDDGIALLENIPLGPARLEIYQPSRLPLVYAFTADSAKEQVRIELPNTRTVALTVVDERGNRLDGFSAIVASAPVGADHLRYQAGEQEDRLTLRDLPAVPLSLFVGRENSWTQVSLGAEETEQEVTLSVTTKSTRLRVRDDDGQNVAGAEVTASLRAHPSWFLAEQTIEDTDGDAEVELDLHGEGLALFASATPPAHLQDNLFHGAQISTDEDEQKVLVFQRRSDAERLSSLHLTLPLPDNPEENPGTAVIDVFQAGQTTSRVIEEVTSPDFTLAGLATGLAVLRVYFPISQEIWEGVAEISPDKPATFVAAPQAESDVTYLAAFEHDISNAFFSLEKIHPHLDEPMLLVRSQLVWKGERGRLPGLAPGEYRAVLIDRAGRASQQLFRVPEIGSFELVLLFEPLPNLLRLAAPDPERGYESVVLRSQRPELPPLRFSFNLPVSLQRTHLLPGLYSLELGAHQFEVELAPRGETFVDLEALLARGR